MTYERSIFIAICSMIAEYGGSILHQSLLQMLERAREEARIAEEQGKGCHVFSDP